MTISQWFNRNGIRSRPWVYDATCSTRQDLPWVDDSHPSVEQHQQMRTVCHQCPVVVACAGYGLTVAGGFYAGVWIPWKSSTGESDNLRRGREQARHVLRLVSKGSTVPA